MTKIEYKAGEYVNGEEYNRLWELRTKLEVEGNAEDLAQVDEILDVLHGLSDKDTILINDE